MNLRFIIIYTHNYVLFYEPSFFFFLSMNVRLMHANIFYIFLL